MRVYTADSNSTYNTFFDHRLKEKQNSPVIFKGNLRSAINYICMCFLVFRDLFQTLPLELKIKIHGNDRMSLEP